jgi:hypothetical protein
MRTSGLATFLGLSTRPFPWERAFLLAAALIVSDVVIFGLGHSQRYSPESGFTSSWFEIGSPWQMLRLLVAQALPVALVVLLLRLLRRDWWAIAAAAALYGLLVQPVNYLAGA